MKSRKPDKAPPHQNTLTTLQTLKPHLFSSSSPAGPLFLLLAERFPEFLLAFFPVKFCSCDWNSWNWGAGYVMETGFAIEYAMV